MSAHTPGPWTVGGKIAGIREDHTAVSGGRDFGCAVMLGNHETDTANAHLIAAAPELLAALKRVGCQDAGSCGRLCDAMPDGPCFVCAAIAKAEGKS